MNLKLAEKIDEIKKLPLDELCAKFHCKPEEICMGDYIARDTNDEICPYKVILGFANFEKSNVSDLGNLEIVYGKKFKDIHGVITDVNSNPVYFGINLKNSKVQNTGKLRKVYGSISFNSNITSLGNIQFLGSNLYLNGTNISDLGELRTVHGRINLEDVKGKLTSLNKLEKAGSIYVDIKTLQYLGDLREVHSIVYGKHCPYSVMKLFNTRFSKQDKMVEAKI